MKCLERKKRKGKGRKGNTTEKDPTQAHLGTFNIVTSVGFDDLHSETLNES